MKNILLIEDDQTVRENTKELLELYDYKVDTATNGDSGVEMALQTSPDIIVCDILMPKLDGYGVYTTLSQNEKTKKIPFIFLSAKTEVKDIRKGMNLGVDDYVTKPFEEEDLINSIESRLAKHAILQDGKSTTDPSIDSIELNTLEELQNYFLEHGEILKTGKNEFIYEEHGNANYIYYIGKGLVKTCRMDELGKELTTGLFNSGDFFGFYSFKDLEPYPESAISIDKSKLYRIFSTTFQEILANNNMLIMEFADILSHNLTEVKEHLLEMAYCSVLKKTTSTLLQFADKLKDISRDSINISRGDLASVAGISTESLIRSLSQLRKQGLIEIEGRNIKIVDLEQLHQIR